MMWHRMVVIVIIVTMLMGVLSVKAQSPNPMSPYTIEALRERDYIGGEIVVLSEQSRTNAYISYIIAYPSDDLTITGLMMVPNQVPASGLFPVIILNHGYWQRSTYTAGTDTLEAAGYFAERGYVTIAPDFRSWGGSDSDSSFFHTGLVIDVINLVSSLPSLSFVDVERVGIWGHSMGGGITTKVLTIDPRIKAGVLYAPNSADDADIIATWGAGCDPTHTFSTAALCNDAEVIPADTSAEVLQAYFAAAADPAMLHEIAPLYHLEHVTAPIQIHIGTADDVTPPAWSNKLYTALRVAGKNVEAFSYEGQGHFFSGQSWFTYMERATAFFDLYLAGNS